MAEVCGIDRIVLSPHSTAGFYWYYPKNNNINNVEAVAYFGDIDDYYEYSPGDIIAINQFVGSFGNTSGFNAVFVVTKGNPTNPGSSENQIDQVPLTSTSGDLQNRLLSTSITGYTLTVKMWALNAKEVTTYNFALPQIYDFNSPSELRPVCFSTYTMPQGTLLNSYCDGTVLVEVQSDGLGDVEYVYTNNSVSCGWVPQLEPVIFTETKTIEYQKGCFRNPVFMVWKNLKGGWDSWLFQNNQIENITTESLGEFFKDYNSLADIRSTSTERGKSAIPSMVLNAEFLTLDQKRGISTILYSNKVYIVGQDGLIISEVRVTPGTFLIEETRKKSFNIEFQIELPQINTVRN